MRWQLGIMAVGLALANAAHAAPLSVDVHRISDEGVAEKLGTVSLENSTHGLIVAPDLRDLPPGTHGFHVHRFPNCGPMGEDGEQGAGKGAGPHLDPLDTNRHGGPSAEVGHAGDLPVLVVNAEGRAILPVVAPRLRLEAIRGHALMIHEGGDNYADEPEPLGGGGARIACGVIAED